MATKEMIAFGTMNIVGSWPFSRSAVNFNAGCKTAVSNIVMAMAVMITLLFLTPLFHYTPLVVLSSIIIAAMLGLIDYNAAIHLWHVDKFDFVVCMGAYIGVVFGSVEIGLVIAVGLSLLRVLLFVARPRTLVLGNIPNSMIYRSVDQYPDTNNVPGVLILEIDAPIYFANASYLRERISRWIDEEEDKLKPSGETGLQYVILDMGAVGNIDTSGISMLEEVKKITDRRGLKLVLANPGGEVMKKLNKSNLIDMIGQEWIYLTVGEAVAACNFMLHSCKPNSVTAESQTWSDNVGLSLLRVLLFVARPRTLVLGNIPNSMIYRSVDQYPDTNNVPGVLILEIDAPIYFANASYLRERISRWIDEEEDKLKPSGETGLQYVILDMGAVGNIDTSGISMLEEVKKITDRRGLKV
ncbi:sulfate transporter 3;2 [Actinidia rufa]|uniref:Sulfate transporter 32 n=1 Tax=Actinidia rufa TaxID=165716 RepID=A0A7J0H9M6_9ERIC|nr:sulfate transporter 3;2 [Actinidia rufa]